jgi:hypothetical protein
MPREPLAPQTAADDDRAAIRDSALPAEARSEPLAAGSEAADVSLNPGWLFLSLLISMVGFGLFLYGKKAGRTPQLATGVVLMIYPYFVSSTAWMVAIAALLILGLWWSVHQGW